MFSQPGGLWADCHSAAESRKILSRTNTGPNPSLRRCSRIDHCWSVKIRTSLRGCAVQQNEPRLVVLNEILNDLD